MITGKANGINYFRDTYSGKLSYPKFWTKEMVEQANSSASDEDKKEKYNANLPAIPAKKGIFNSNCNINAISFYIW